MKPMYLHRSNCGQLPPIKRGYDKKFRASAAYRASMPDMMEVAHEAIHGANVPIILAGHHVSTRGRIWCSQPAGRGRMVGVSINGSQ